MLDQQQRVRPNTGDTLVTVNNTGMPKHVDAMEHSAVIACILPSPTRHIVTPSPTTPMAISRDITPLPDPAHPGQDAADASSLRIAKGATPREARLVRTLGVLFERAERENADAPEIQQAS